MGETWQLFKPLSVSEIIQYIHQIRQIKVQLFPALVVGVYQTPSLFGGSTKPESEEPQGPIYF